MAPKTHRAIKTVEGQKAELQVVPVPRLRDDYVLCKVLCVALNPTDWKHIDYIAKPGSTVGCDFAGVVEEVGSKVEKQWKKGERIGGFLHGSNESEYDDGSFGEYAVVKGDIGFRIPSTLTDEEASSVGVGVITCGQALYQSLGLPLPGSGKFGGYVLIYGASTATGTLAVQYAALSGAKVIAVCSEKNFPLVKDRNAEAVFSYQDPECSKKIREYTHDELTLVMDCISEGDSPKICEQAVSSKGGKISYLLRPEHTRTDVENKRTLGYTCAGEAFHKMGGHFDAKPSDLEFTKKFWELSERLFASKQLKPHPVEVREEGLKGVFDGLQQLRDGKVSGVKLVYRVEETP